MIKLIGSKSQNTQLLCQKYWSNIDAVLFSRTRFDFADANQVLLGNALPDMYTTSSLIKQNDLTQRLTGKEIKEALTIWRGIPEKIGDFPQYIKNLYQKCKALKKGDVLYMPEYSFWSDDRKHALERAIVFSSSNSGILYEVTLPSGYNLYEEYHPILPRASKFLCLGNRKIKSIKKGFEYNLIKLKLLPRDVNIKD